MELSLKGKNAIVCASSAGIGKAIAKGLLKEGANVTILGRDQERLDSAMNELNSVEGKGQLIAHSCDLGKIEDIKKVYEVTKEKFGSIDILVNNQGGPKPGGFDDLNIQDIREALEINLYSALELTKLCLPDMQANKWGRIINILSISAKESLPNMFLSNMIRPAIVGFAKTVATENAANGITVNNLLPSAVLSDRTNFFIQKAADEAGIAFEEQLEKVAQTLPPKKIATPEEFSQMALFLASENASYVNGTSICIDGGLSKGII